MKGNIFIAIWPLQFFNTYTNIRVELWKYSGEMWIMWIYIQQNISLCTQYCTEVWDYWGGGAFNIIFLFFRFIWKVLVQVI